MIYEELPGDVFDVEADYYCHACNCKGSWGAGIAAQFKERFPFEYEDERALCAYEGEGLVGTASITGKVICLYTSRGYGRYVDKEVDILRFTKSALEWLRSDALPPGLVIASPRFNAGLFNVPWEKTREILLDVFKDFDITWKVRYL